MWYNHRFWGLGWASLEVIILPITERFHSFRFTIQIQFLPSTSVLVFHNVHEILFLFTAALLYGSETYNKADNSGVTSVAYNSILRNNIKRVHISKLLRISLFYHRNQEVSESLSVLALLLSSLWDILIYLAVVTKCHGLGGLKNRNLFSHSLEAGSLRSRCLKAMEEKVCSTPPSLADGCLSSPCVFTKHFTFLCLYPDLFL